MNKLRILNSHFFNEFIWNKYIQNFDSYFNMPRDLFKLQGLSIMNANMVIHDFKFFLTVQVANINIEERYIAI